MNQPRNTPHVSETIVLEDVSKYPGQRTPDQQSTNSISFDTQPPEPTVSALPKWNELKTNEFKTMSTFFGFLLMGANDAVCGTIIPYLQNFYGVSNIVVCLVFPSPMIGYVSAAAINNISRQKIGQRGVAITGPGSRLVAYMIISLHSPYPVSVVTFILAGLGNGIFDATWNAWLVSCCCGAPVTRNDAD